MQKKYVIGLLMLAMTSLSGYAAEKHDLSTAPKLDDPAYERLPAGEKAKVDELEKVLQSTYDYNTSMKELGDPNGGQ